jgi:copper resistance protein B
MFSNIVLAPAATGATVTIDGILKVGTVEITTDSGLLRSQQLRQRLSVCCAIKQGICGSICCSSYCLLSKSEGQQDTAFKADYDVDFQLLYGRFVWKYYDIQVGGRMETQSFRGGNVTRGLGVIGLQGIVPYNYEFESALFIDQSGAVSARLSYTKDFLLTQRLVLQGRFQTNLAIQRVEEFTTGSGLNNLEFGARLRYEIRRELAPYIGLSFDRSFGETATLVRQQGGDPSQIRFVVGVRMWY